MDRLNQRRLNFKSSDKSSKNRQAKQSIHIKLSKEKRDMSVSFKRIKFAKESPIGESESVDDNVLIEAIVKVKVFIIYFPFRLNL